VGLIPDCVLCAEHFLGFGNDPAPLAEFPSQCFNVCNFTKVLPARELEKIRTQQNEVQGFYKSKKEQLTKDDGVKDDNIKDDNVKDDNVKNDKMKEERDCVLCDDRFFGFGNNPAPLAELPSLCCSTCNFTKAMPARLTGLKEHKNEKE
jgi:hypothetical protein